MEDPLEIYRRKIAEQPVCEASWFSGALARFRAGDEASARAISGCCLRLALQRAEDRAAIFADLPVFDLIQEANAGLMEAVTTFSGSTLEEFWPYAEQKIQQRLALLVQHV